MSTGPTRVLNAEETTKRLLEIIPFAMHSIRSEMRKLPNPDFTIAQLRTLGHVTRGINSVTSLADKLGVSTPGMSKMLTELERKGLVERTSEKEDRRQIHVSATHLGKGLYLKLRESTVTNLSPLVEALSLTDQDDLLRGLAVIERLFSNRNKD